MSQIPLTDLAVYILYAAMPTARAECKSDPQRLIKWSTSVCRQIRNSQSTENARAIFKVDDLSGLALNPWSWRTENKIEKNMGAWRPMFQEAVLDFVEIF